MHAYVGCRLGRLLPQGWATGSLRPDLLRQLLRAVLLVAPSMQPQALANTMHGLGRLGAAWKELLASEAALQGPASAGAPRRQDPLSLKSVPVSLPLCSIVAQRLDCMTEQGLSNTIYGLAQMGARWLDLPAQLQASIEASIRLESRLRDLTPLGTSNTLYALALLGVDWLNISPAFRSCLERNARRLLHKMNELGVTKTLYS